ncbi:hypothetical protein JXA85_01620 [Candidatus Woesearchaeota archaeon]|nr:hypothetical protein [Candidatus Woesearchaeota archaeon]
MESHDDFKFDGDWRATPTTFFDNYPDWIKLRATELRLPEYISGGIPRKRLGELLFQLSVALLLKSQKEKEFVRISREYNLNSLNSFINEFIEKNYISLKGLEAHYTEINRGRFEHYQQDGIKCIAQVIAGCLNPYGNNVDYLTLFDLHKRDGQLKKYEEKDIRNYDKILSRHFNIESKFIKSPYDYVAFLLAGYPIVKLHVLKDHAYAATGFTTGYEIKINVTSERINIQELNIFINTTVGYDDDYKISFNQVPKHFYSTKLVLNPVKLGVSSRN